MATSLALWNCQSVVHVWLDSNLTAMYMYCLQCDAGFVSSSITGSSSNVEIGGGILEN